MMTAIDTRSILDYLNEDTPFGLSSRVTIRGEACIAVGLDNGNDAAKITLLNDAGKVVTIRIPTAHQLAKTFQGGQGEVTYQLGDETGFWIGEAAIRNAGRALRVGSTATRITDTRHANFLAGCLVEAMLAAGFVPGAYHLALGFAVPNSEIVKESPDSDKLVVSAETKGALRKHVQDKAWQITRTDERGKLTTWQLTVRHLVPQAQSVGTFVAWAKAPNGRTVTDYDALTILDVGGGDLQQTDITLKPSYRMASERRGDGTIDIARGLKQLLPKAKFNDVTAQYALITRQALISGKMQTIEKEVVSVIDSYGQDLVGKMLEIVQETRRFLVITGGGAILLKKTMLDMLDAAEVEADRDYFLVNQNLASALNSVGALFAVLFMAAKKS
jgi:hypothetical protein